MKHPISEIAFTPIVKVAQEKRGSRTSYAKMEQRGEQGPWRDVVTPELAQYIAERDSLYLDCQRGWATLHSVPRRSERFPQGARRAHARVRGLCRGMPNTSRLATSGKTTRRSSS